MWYTIMGNCIQL